MRKTKSKLDRMKKEFHNIEIQSHLNRINKKIDLMKEEVCADNVPPKKITHKTEFVF